MMGYACCCSVVQLSVAYLTSYKVSAERSKPLNSKDLSGLKGYLSGRRNHVVVADLY
jgi:hypothetical protein